MGTDAARVRGGLPAPLTSFLGRRGEVARVKEALRAHRLVTVVGPGGVGKTRLALEVAHQLARSYPNGCWFIDLGHLPGRRAVADHIASTLGMTRESGQWSVEELAARLSDRKTLLLFDNCEHVIDEVAHVMDGLLRSTTDLDVLATSRQATGVGGEALMHLDGLSFPETSAGSSPAALAGFESVALFLERARAITPGVELTAENAAAIADIAHRLEGMPLAIELAAVRTRVLSPQQIARRLENQFRLLGARRGVEQRHHTLRAAIEWSYDLCSPREQLCWARLSVFPADFDIDAAEAVVADGDIAVDDCLELLGALVDKSILRTAPAPTGEQETVRYRFPESMREFGREVLARLESPSSATERHLRHFHHMTAAVPEVLFGRSQVRRVHVLRTERPNLEAALAQAVALGDIDRADELACSIALVAFVGGSLAESAEALETARSFEGRQSPARVRLLWLSAWLAITQGDMTLARQRAAACLDLAGHVGDRLGAAHAEQYLGQCELQAGSVPEAERLTARAVQVARGENDQHLLATSLVRHAQVLQVRGEHGEAERELHEAIAISDAVGELWCRAFALWNLALLMHDRGRAEEAEARAREMLDSRDKFRDVVGIAQGLEVMAWCAADLGDARRGTVLLGAAGSIWATTKAALPATLGQCHEQYERRLEQEVGATAYVALWSAGASMRPEEALGWPDGVADHAASPSSEPPVSVELASVATSPLTRREREIATLVAQGLKNREIAEQLVISIRTAEAHVEHILTKLGFTSRTQISSWAAHQASS